MLRLLYYFAPLNLRHAKDPLLLLTQVRASVACKTKFAQIMKYEE